MGEIEKWAKKNDQKSKTVIDVKKFHVTLGGGRRLNEITRYLTRGKGGRKITLFVYSPLRIQFPER